jgi:hypothetical protein
LPPGAVDGRTFAVTLFAKLIDFLGEVLCHFGCQIALDASFLTSGVGQNRPMRVG